MINLAAPPSKSVTHRAFMLAARSNQPCTVAHPLLGADCRSTLAVLRGMGASWRLDANGDVHFDGSTWQAPKGPLDCGNSGTTLRLYSGQASLYDFPVTLTGDDSLRSRPNGSLLAALAELGVKVSSNAGKAPITLNGPILAGEVTLPGGLSSQYTSALMLALAQVPGDSQVHLEAPVASRPYLDLTVEVAAAFGLRFEIDEDDTGLTFTVPGGQTPSTARYYVEGDWSGAAFPLVAAAITGQTVCLDGLREHSAQGDKAIAHLVAKFGAEVHWDGTKLLCTGKALNAIDLIDVGAVPDLFPILCVLAACAKGTTRIDGSPGLRHKECDRIAAMAIGLQRCGVQVEQLPGGLIVHGSDRREGAQIEAHHDHRIHMAFSVLGLVSAGQMQVDSADSAAVSYPDFHQHLKALST